MTEIKAKEVMKLRQMTGSGMMDCKKALSEASGDFEKAIEVLRKKGQKVAAKRADRDSKEGAAIAMVNNEKNTGISIVLGCETDFVGKNEDFVSLAKNLATHALQFEKKEDFLKSDFNGMTVNEKLIEQTGVIGEKIEIVHFSKIAAPFVSSYIHAGNKIATLVGFSKIKEGIEEVGKDVAMQVAAMNPIALDEKGVDATMIEKEMEIAKEQLRSQGKPEAMLEHIAKGKLKRFFKDNTLVNQIFIKDNKKTVGEYVKSIGDIHITDFSRVAIGQ